MKTTMMALVLLGGALFLGCSKENKEEPAKITATGTATATDSTGIPECDDYIKRAEECFTKNPAMKAQTEGALRAVKEMAKVKAATPAGKDEMKLQCKQHTDLLATTCK